MAVSMQRAKQGQRQPGVYERLNVKPIIHCNGTATRYGGGLMLPEVVSAMVDAATSSVRMDELQAAAGKVIARVTGAEAGYVTNSCSAGLFLGIAACMTGLDVALMNRLPDTTGMRNEVLMPLHQVSGYSRIIEATGAKLVKVGFPNDTAPPSQVYVNQAWEVESNITDRTAAILYAVLPGGHPPLHEVVAIGRKYGIPVVVDAAGQVPPVSNLRKFIATGADLVAFSGGKGIQGPQDSGILCGKRRLIQAAALQNLDMAEASFETWDPPRELIPKEDIRGLPLHGLGRSMKASKEAIVGLVTALEYWTEERSLQTLAQRGRWLEEIAAGVAEVDGVKTQLGETAPGAHPILKVILDRDALGRGAADVIHTLKSGDPPIWVNELSARDNVVIFHSVNLNVERTRIVAARLRQALTE